MRRPELVVFDVNETLLSLAPIRQAMANVFGPEPPTGEWFARLLHGSLLANELDDHRPFGEIGVDALIALGRRRGLTVERSLAAEIVGLMASLPAHPDVLPAVERMRAAGLRMVTLTNGSADVARSQVDNAGIAPFLVDVVSVDAVGKFKPHPAPYRTGAVFVERPGAIWGLPSQQPETIADLGILAERLLS